MDSLVFGSPKVIKGLSIGDKKWMWMIEAPKVLEGLGLDKQQFIEFSILCGTDYSSKIGNIGPIKAYSMI